MPGLYRKLNGKGGKSVKVLARFVDTFCRENHRDRPRDTFLAKSPELRQALGDLDPVLCADCRKLLQHAVAKLLQCPYDPKPMCKKCETHCYAPGYREKMREVMRFSGLYMVKHGRLDMMFHYFF